MDKTQVIQKIEKGVVIDHIPAGSAQLILKILGLRDQQYETYLGQGVPSEKLRKKDFIKVVNLVLDETDVNKIALIAPQATVNRIADFGVAEKVTIRIPDVIENILKCPNYNCISNAERFCTTRFTKQVNTQISLICHYCDHVSQGSFEFL